MKSKSYIQFTLVIGMIFLSFLPTISLATNDKTDLGIEFYKIIDSGGTNPSTIYPEKPSINPSGLLPHTGELINSYILLLLGITLVIIALGIISIRKILTDSPA